MMEKTDPNGNLWFGTMDNLERNIEKGSLYN
jgi:sugar lactone lactonase YvrE